MTSPEQDTAAAPPLPEGYPDPEVVGWARTTDIEFAGLHIRMTITPGESIVQLWELDGGHPVQWLGNAFRIGTDRPVLRLSYNYGRAIPRISQQDQLAREASRFWMG